MSFDEDLLGQSLERQYEAMSEEYYSVMRENEMLKAQLAELQKQNAWFEQQWDEEHRGKMRL
jgi:hypothetical protein